MRSPESPASIDRFFFSPTSTADVPLRLDREGVVVVVSVGGFVADALHGQNGRGSVGFGKSGASCQALGMPLHIPGTFQHNSDESTVCSSHLELGACSLEEDCVRGSRAIQREVLW